MDRKNHLDEMKIANLSEEQLRQLKQAEAQLNQGGEGVYLIAVQKETPSA